MTEEMVLDLREKRCAIRTYKNGREKVLIGKVRAITSCGHTNMLFIEDYTEKFIKYNELKNYDLLRIYEE